MNFFNLGARVSGVPFSMLIINFKMRCGTKVSIQITKSLIEARQYQRKNHDNIAIRSSKETLKFRPRGNKKNSMLNSAEHEKLPAHKC